MVVAEIVDLPDVFVARAADRGIGNGQELVGGLAHGGNDYYRMPLLAGLDDTGDALNRGGTLYRAAAELHHDHQSSIPSECISSAFNTAAPAAPRMVLWLSTTNLASRTGQARRRPTKATMPRSRSASLRGCGRLASSM